MTLCAIGSQRKMFEALGKMSGCQILQVKRLKVLGLSTLARDTDTKVLRAVALRQGLLSLLTLLRNASDVCG